MRGALTKWVAGWAAVAVGTAAAAAPPPLVSVEWLKAEAARPGVVLLDLRPAAVYEAAHIPGAVGSDYSRDGWRVTNAAGVDSMLPETAVLEKKIGALGIGNAHHVVLVAVGRSAADIGVATRVYWTFKVLGHDAVSILDGGMAAYTAARRPDKKTPLNPLEAGRHKPVPQTFKARLRTRYLATTADVATAVAAGRPLLDARPHDQYVGVNKSSKAKRHGTLPGARHLPGAWLTEDGGGRFRAPSELRQLLEYARVPSEGTPIAFCNSGHWASVTWFVTSELLGHEVRLYDGSMHEWTADAVRPVERKAPLK